MFIRSLRRAWLRRKAFPKDWTQTLESLAFVGDLAPGPRARLELLVRYFIAEVHWEGASGLVVTDEMRVSIAAQACRLILGLPDDAYRRVRTIYLYPSSYSTTEVTLGKNGVSEERKSIRHGEAWLRGPVVLSWDAARHGIANPDDGRNVVYHEFAHKLDMLDDQVDGRPPVANREQHDAWVHIVQEEFEALVEAKRRGKKTLLDKYGAEKPAEFFAVATEAFFERPARVRDRHAELYACLSRFYNQNPARGEVGEPAS